MQNRPQLKLIRGLQWYREEDFVEYKPTKEERLKAMTESSIMKVFLKYAHGSWTYEDLEKIESQFILAMDEIDALPLEKQDTPALNPILFIT